MELSYVLFQKIVEYLNSLPNINDLERQKKLIYDAGLYPQLHEQIPFGAPSARFFRLLLPILIGYDGRNAVEAVLEATKNYVGQDRKAACEVLIQELHNEDVQDHTDHTVELPHTLDEKIIAFFTSLKLYTSDSLRNLIYSAGLAAELQNQINFNLPVPQFFSQLVRTLRSYGRLSDERYALEAVLEATKELMKYDKELMKHDSKKAYCDTLIQELRDERLKKKQDTRQPMAFNEKIIDFFLSIPNIESIDTRQTLIERAGLDSNLEHQIMVDVPIEQFSSQFIETLRSYGILEDGRHALEAVLQVAKNYVGTDGKEHCENLIQELHDENRKNTHEIELVPTLYEKIVAFLASLPNMYDSMSQQALIYSAGLFDTQLHNQIPFGKPPTQFSQLLVPILIEYGRANDGRNALEAILEATKQFIGIDRKVYCDNLIRALRSNKEIQGEVNIKLSPVLQQEIFEMLTGLPNLETSGDQQALAHSAGLDHELYDQISFGISRTRFVQNLISTLVNYGTLNDGRHALVSVLEAAKQRVGNDKGMKLDRLIQEIYQLKRSLNLSDIPDLMTLQQIEKEFGGKLSLYEYGDNQIDTVANTYLIDTNTIL